MTQPAHKFPYLHGLTGQMARQKVAIESSLTIGSDTRQQMQLLDDSVAPAHAVITNTSNKLQLQATDKVLLNGEAVNSATLRSGDELLIGQQRFVVKYPALRPDSVLRDVQVDKPSRARLYWLFGLLTISAGIAGWYFMY